MAAQTQGVQAESSKLVTVAIVSSGAAPILSDSRATKSTGDTSAPTGNVADVGNLMAGRKAFFDGTVTSQPPDVGGLGSGQAADQLMGAAPVSSEFQAPNKCSEASVFDAVLSQYNLAATVQEDGSSCTTSTLPGLLDGTVIAERRTSRAKPLNWRPIWSWGNSSRRAQSHERQMGSVRGRIASQKGAASQ